LLLDSWADANVCSPDRRTLYEIALEKGHGEIAELLKTYVLMVMSILLLPTLYVWFAGEHDVLPIPEGEFEN
jgi:hypothetical protein